MGNIVLVSPVVQVCRCCVCAHVTLQTGAIGGQERIAIPAATLGQASGASLCRALQMGRWLPSRLLFAWALAAAAVRWSLCMNRLSGLALCVRGGRELMSIHNN
jgi:hypothetical protein